MTPASIAAIANETVPDPAVLPLAAPLSVPSGLLSAFLSDDVRAWMSGLIGEAIAAAVAYSHEALAPATRRAYDAEWDGFAVWCLRHGAEPLSAAPSLVASYLATRAETLGRSSLRRCLAAIAHVHRHRGHPWTSNHPIVAAVMRGILRRHGAPVRPAAALGTAEVRTLLATCDGHVDGLRRLVHLRDRAQLLAGFAGRLCRSELVEKDFQSRVSPLLTPNQWRSLRGSEIFQDIRQIA